MTAEQLIDSAVSKICSLVDAGEFVPIMEADVCGFIYYSLIKEGVCNLKDLHLATRVIGMGDADKIDIVSGVVVSRADGRPAVSPQTVVEVKVFVQGFTPQQCRIRLGHILADDLRKLGSVQSEAVGKILLIYDELGYLAGRFGGVRRMDVVVARRNEIAPDADILVAGRYGGEWKIQVIKK